MNDNIEELILSGQFFNSGRDSSPTRSSSPSSELGELTFSSEPADDPAGPYSNTLGSHAHSHQTSVPSGGGGVGVGVTGRTGVKGVIRDADEQAQINRSLHATRIDALNRQMEKSALVAPSYLDEEREKAKALLDNGDELDETVDPLVRREMMLGMSRDSLDMNVFGRAREEGKFGHLREVGMKGYLGAVEKEERGVWVVVHLYEPFVDRCYTLDDTLARLARQYPFTKFIRCRASVLGFASSPSATRPSPSATSQKTSGIRQSKPSLFAGKADSDDDDDDEPVSRSVAKGYRDEDEDEDEDDDSDDDGGEEADHVEVDTDMLPTVLVYRNGELVFNWVRVDWEAGEEGVTELFMRHNIIPRNPYTGEASDLLDDEIEEELAGLR